MPRSVLVLLLIVSLAAVAAEALGMSSAAAQAAHGSTHSWLAGPFAED